MTAIPLSIGLPPYADPDSAVTLTERPTFYNGGLAASAEWEVRGGEAWLMQMMCAGFQTGGAVGNRQLNALLNDPDGNVRYMTGSSQPIPTASGVQVSAALGATDGGFLPTGPGASGGGFSVGLPWLVLPASWTWVLFIAGSGPADTLNGGFGVNSEPLAIVTRWLVTGSGPGAELEFFVPALTPDEVSET